jgi:hypothetical protein
VGGGNAAFVRPVFKGRGQEQAVVVVLKVSAVYHLA